MKIAVTGASGLIGRALLPALRADGHEVVRLVRGRPQAADERPWDPPNRTLDPHHLDDVDAVVHLAGAGIADRRWTSTYRDVIRSSRVNGTATIAAAMVASGHPRVLLSGSAIGWYGDTGNHLTDESGPVGTGFLAGVVRDWEAETAPAEAAGIRTAHLRTGIVLSAEGGALAKQVRVARLGLGAPLGSGQQWSSWISIEDEVGAVRHLLSADVAGPVNLVAPHPVTNRDFTAVLNKVVRRPTFPVPVPGFALKAILGEFAEEGVLIGQRLTPTVLESSNYRFVHPELEGALRAILS